MINESLRIKDIGEVSLSVFAKNHPQLSEKAIVDYINGLEVINDQISFNNQIINSGSFMNKILEEITGKTNQRQLIINQNVATSLETISIWLKGLENYKIDNDITIARLASKLIQVRNSTKKLGSKLNDLDNRIVEFQHNINTEFKKLSERIHRTEAKNHIDLVVTKWKNELWDKYPILVSLCLCIDELYWGDFGIYCRCLNASQKVDELMEYLRNLVFDLVKDKVNINRNELFIVFKLLEPIDNLTNEKQEMLAYICNWADLKIAPFTWFVYCYATDYKPLYVNENFPIVISSARLFDRLVSEQHERYKSI